VSAADIPEIMNLIKSKSNSKLEFNFGGQENYAAAPGGGEVHDTNLTITQVMTDEIMASTLNGITNYAFQMTTNSNNYVLNLVVKEWYGVNIIYFSKYVPNNNLIAIDFNNFTGDIYYYDETGAYQAKVTMIGGASSSNITYDAPCPDSDGNPIDPDGNDGSGSSGLNCYYNFTTTVTECGGSNSGTPHPADTLTEDNCGGDGTGGIVITTMTWTCNGSQSAPPQEEIFFDPPCSNNGGGSSGGGPNTNSCPGVTPCADVQSFDQNCVCVNNFNPVTPINTNTVCDKKNLVSSFNSPFNVNLNSVSDCNDEITTPEDEKFMCIYNKLTNSPSFKNLIIDTFGESTTLNIEIKLSDTISDSRGGFARRENYTLNSDNTVESMDVLIGINENNLNSTHATASSPLDIAKTILHESIHAYLYVKILDCSSAAPLQNYEDLEIEEILNQFYDDFTCEYDANGVPQSQHDFMFNYMIPTLAGTLQEIKDLLIPQNQQQYLESLNYYSEGDPNNPLTESHPFNWDEFFKNIVIEGLHNTDAVKLKFEQDPIAAFLFNQNVSSANILSKSCNE
jgi:hypothetical protein